MGWGRGDVGGGRGRGGGQLQISAWPVITTQSEYTGRVDFNTIAPTCVWGAREAGSGVATL